MSGEGGAPDRGGPLRTGSPRRPPEPFGRRLAAAMDAYGPLCVGIDPHPGLLDAWGLADDATGLREFALRVVDALAGRVAALKPQSAFFERHGARGVAVLEEVVAAVRAADGGTQLVIDAKRGDIGSTMAGYADAFLAEGAPLAGDALTVSPYLGLGSLGPAFEVARQTGRGLFVLALTSNPEGSSVQHATSGVESVAGVIARGVGELNAAELRAAGSGAVRPGGAAPDDRAPDRRAPDDGAPGHRASDDRAPDAAPGSRVLGSVGLVVGATVGDAVSRLGIDLAAVRGPLLAPGVGAQGAGPAELAQVFGRARTQVLASTSRAVLTAGPAPDELRRAAERARADVAQALSGP